MGFLSNFAAGAANTASDLYAKSSILDQQQAAELMKAQRIAEMQQQFKIQDEQRHAANAKQSGAEIEAEAQGMLTRGQNAQVKGLYGADGADLTDADISDEERNAFQPDETDKIKAGAAAARKLGKLDAAKEYDTAYRGMVADKIAQERAGHDRDLLEETSRHNKESEKNNAEKIQAMLTNHSLTQQLAQARAEKKLPEATKAAVDAYWKTYEGIKKDTGLPAEDVKKRLDDLESDFMQKFPPVGFDEMKGGKVRVETALGTSKIYDSKEAAAEALGFGKPKPAAAPDNKASPVADAIRTSVQDAIDGKTSEPYTPPPDSPAAKRAGMIEAQRKKDKQGMDEAFADAEEKVMLALKTGDPNDAQAAQDSPGFRFLPQSYQTKIFKLVNGR